jgi:predicted SnoaL-like aldol condensation-catalyzing enzyme
LIRGFVDDILMGGNPEIITSYISTEKYHQHNPAVDDGLAALGEALAAMAKAGTPMVYEKNHLILGEGNFVLSVSEGQFLGKHSSFYDLFRIENGKIVEHWDTIETIPPRDQWKNDNGKF